VRVVGVAPHQRRHVERDRQPATAGVEDHPVPLVGLLALPNPANCRMVQVRPRYPVGYSPRGRVLPRPADPLEPGGTSPLGPVRPGSTSIPGQRGEVRRSGRRRLSSAPASTTSASSLSASMCPPGSSQARLVSGAPPVILARTLNDP
jgi:hypothetical protein